MPNANQIISLTSRQQGGADAKRIGREFEHLILASQRDAQGQFCELVRIGNFAKRIPTRGYFGTKLIEEKSPFDFAGCVTGGQAIFFDAKASGKKNASFRANNPLLVKPHQIAALCRLHEAGAIAGFLVRCERMKDYRWLNPHHAKALKPIRWESPDWFVLGPIAGPWVPLRKLVEAFR